MDMKRENFSAISSLITQIQQKIFSEGNVTESRARFRAIDRVAATLIPPENGDALAHWLAITANEIAQEKKNGNGVKAMELPKVTDFIIESGDAVDFPKNIVIPGSTTYRAQIINALGNMDVGQFKYLKAASLKQVQRIQRNLSCLKEVNRWQYKSVIDKSTNTVYIKRTA